LSASSLFFSEYARSLENSHTERQEYMPKQKTVEPQAPPWASELSEKYQSGIAYAFILHGNVQDYIGGIAGQTLKNYLLASFAQREIVVYWNMESGFYLPAQEMRQQFADIVGLQSQTQQPGRGGGLAGGLNAIASQGSDLAAMLERVKNPAIALEYLSRLLRYKPPKKRGEPQEKFRVSVILDYAEYLAPETTGTPSEQDRLALVTLSEWGRDPLIAGNEAIIVMVAAELSELNERLRRSGVRWEQIEVPFPDFSQRVAFMQQLLLDMTDVSMAENYSIEDFARMTTGLRLIDLEDIMLRASFHQEPISRALVKQRKDEIMKSEYAELLQVEESDFGFEAIGGMEEVKTEVRDTIIYAMQTGLYQIVPMGVLEIGPPGTGKTKFGRALSKEAGFTFVVLNLAKIFHRFVGDTERRLERGLYAIKAMAPCIVFIDEIDQAVGRGESGDSGVSNRVFKRLMEFMSDTTLRGKVLFLAATNRPDLLDKALLRPGRFDKKIPFFVPEADERAEILAILTRESFGEQGLPTQEEFHTLALQMTDEYTGAELEALVVKAGTT
jgi:transitional endoplasmic reticulum ATPase